MRQDRHKTTMGVVTTATTNQSRDTSPIRNQELVDYRKSGEAAEDMGEEPSPSKPGIIGEDRNQEWTYIGHGEWTILDREQGKGPQYKVCKQGPTEIKWMQELDRNVKLHHDVMKGGYPNRFGARIPVKSNWNLQLLEDLLVDYKDKEIVEWLKYGWPTGRLPGAKEPQIWGKNHKGAEEHPQALKEYTQKELRNNAIMGPYQKIPFNGKIGISPLSTRPKKDSEERRVILDLSFPIGEGINDSIPKDSYLGFQAKITFPKTDDFAYRIFQLGEQAAMFKIDLSRYFRQIPLDPGDYSLIGYIIDGQIYFDKVLPWACTQPPT